jgi:hypothetical protein
MGCLFEPRGSVPLDYGFCLGVKNPTFREALSECGYTRLFLYVLHTF